MSHAIDHTQGRRGTFLLALALVGALQLATASSPVWAQWRTWEDLGGDIVGAPAAASWGPGGWMSLCVDGTTPCTTRFATGRRAGLFGNPSGGLG